MSTQAEIQAAQKAEYEELVARVEALEAAVFDETEEPPPEEAPPDETDGEEPLATSKSRRHA